MFRRSDEETDRQLRLLDQVGISITVYILGRSPTCRKPFLYPCNAISNVIGSVETFHDISRLKAS